MSEATQDASSSATSTDAKATGTETSTSLLEGKANETTQTAQVTETTGEKKPPEWLNDPAFWDKEKGEIRTQELFKSRQDLRAQVSRGLKDPAPESPDKYEYKPAEGLEALIPADDPVLAEFKKAAHADGISNDLFNKVVNAYGKIAMQFKGEEAKPPTPEQIEADKVAELKKINPDINEAKKTVNSLDQFLQGKVKQGILTMDDYKVMQGIAVTAEAVSVMSKLISVVYRGQNIPMVGTVDANGYSREQFHRDVGDPRYNSDPIFRKEALEKMKRLTGEV